MTWGRRKGKERKVLPRSLLSPRCLPQSINKYIFPSSQITFDRQGNLYMRRNIVQQNVVSYNAMIQIEPCPESSHQISPLKTLHLLWDTPAYGDKPSIKTSLEQYRSNEAFPPMHRPQPPDRSPAPRITRVAAKIWYMRSPQQCYSSSNIPYPGLVQCHITFLYSPCIIFPGLRGDLGEGKVGF